MYEVDITTRFNVINIAVDDMSELDEVLSMPYVISYTSRMVTETDYKKLNKPDHKVLVKRRSSNNEKDR